MTSDAITESVRSTVLSTIVIQRRVREAITELEKSDPQSDLLRQYRVVQANVLRKLQQCREHAEFVLRFTDVTLADLEVIAAYLRVIASVESEFDSAGGTTH